MSPDQPTARRNVIWVFGDQHRGQTLGHMGDPNVCTPNIDRLANNGFTSTAAVGGSPLCCPYRGSLLSGRYPHLCVPGHEYPYPDGMPTLAHPLKDAGYHTAWIGKWHVDGFKERTGRAALHSVPRARRGGFDLWLGFENNNAQYDSYVHGHDASGNEIAHYRLPGYETDALTDLLINYLTDRSTQPDQPFFAGLSVQPPHNPYVAPAEFMGRHTPARVELRPNVPNIPRIVDQARRGLAGYHAMIENLDWNLGRLYAALDRLGLQDSTTIIFFSDHGDMHGSHGQFLKTSPWEESIRVPFSMGNTRSQYGCKSQREAIPINHVDITATTLGLCDVPVPDYMQGYDYSHRYIAGRKLMKPEPDSAFLQMVIPTMHGNSVDRPWRGIVTTDGWKYACLEHQPFVMFNLNEDPYEQANLAFNTRFAVKRKQLHERLKQWIESTQDQFPLPEIS